MSKYFDVGFARQAHTQWEQRVAELEQQINDAQNRLKGSVLLGSTLDSLNLQLTSAKNVLREIEGDYEYQEVLRKDREYAAQAPQREIARLRQNRIEREGHEYEALIARVEAIRGWREAGVHTILEKIQISAPFLAEVERRQGNFDEAAMLARGINSRAVERHAATAGVSPELVRTELQNQIAALVGEGRVEVSVQNERTGQWFILSREANGLLWVDRDSNRNVSQPIQ